jgi:probable phosphoglycerate mutase
MVRAQGHAMIGKLPIVSLARHGQTAWTLSHQHTGVSDLPLTAAGEAEALRLGDSLAGKKFAAVFTSPLQRARRTCELAGFGRVAVIEPDLVEIQLWDQMLHERSASQAQHPQRREIA